MAGGFALCVALVPGTAWAEDETSPPAAPEVVTDVLEAGQDGGREGGPGAQQQAATPEEQPPFEIPPELVAAFEELAAQAGISEECVTGVAESLELIINGIARLPAELEQLGTELAAAVQESLDTESPTPLEEFLSGLDPSTEDPEGTPTPPIGGDIAAGLEQLAETLESEACRPAAPAEEQPPTHNPPANPPASYQPPQQQAAPAPPPAQAAVYPGYAPTGAEEVEGGPSPAATGVALALLAGSAVWTGRRWRAAHHGG